jgi:hypothetical protein
MYSLSKMEVQSYIFVGNNDYAWLDFTTVYDSGPFAIFVCGNSGLSLPVNCAQPDNPGSGLCILNRTLLWGLHLLRQAQDAAQNAGPITGVWLLSHH